MTQNRQCTRCQAELPEDAPGNRCPKCLLELGLQDSGSDLEHKAPPADPLRPKEGEWIGRYRLLQQIGEGGCGVVYMADQEEPVRRRVALKVIKLGMDTKTVIARFEAERQALAMMDHPNIARVFDGGATEIGRPYFVMELVRGMRITEYCDQHQLSTSDRLELFIQVCQAVQHAHQKGIIHRDLKPSNILVTVNDGIAVPKVIDFGVAKATEQRLTDKTLLTHFDAFIGTPAYMSPEQAEMSSLDIDTRSDIYSLGVLLYELLTGQTPFDARDLLQSGIEAMRRTIREKEPARPSTRLRTLTKQELTTTARHRRMEAPRLISTLRGDLDWIVMKCLDKNRTRRYETANAVAGDIQRHLANEPVLAGPPSTIYRMGKAVRRNKLAFTAAAMVLAALIAGMTVSTWSLVKEKEARRRAVAAENLQSELRQQAESARRRAEARVTALLYWQAFEALPETNDAQIKRIVSREEIPIGDASALAARYDHIFKLLTRAAAMKSGCDWAEDTVDRPETWFPSPARIRHITRAARLRAKVALFGKRPEDACQDLLVIFVLGRHVAANGMLTTLGSQSEIESQVVALVAENFHQFTTDSLVRLAQGIESAPPRANAARGAEKEGSFPSWLIDKMQEFRASADGEDIRALTKMRGLLTYAFGERGDEMMAAAGGTSDGVIAYIQELFPFYQMLKRVALASPEKIDAEGKRVGAIIATSSNLMVQWILPNLHRARAREIEVLTQLAMLQGAVAYKQRGMTGLESVRDPFGKGPFEFSRVEEGFELHSTIERYGLKGRQVFVEKAGR